MATEPKFDIDLGIKRLWQMDKVKAQELLEAAASAQTAFWDALRELEGELGRDLDDEEGRDFTDMTLDDLLEGHEAGGGWAAGWDLEGRMNTPGGRAEIDGQPFGRWIETLPEVGRRIVIDDGARGVVLGYRGDAAWGIDVRLADGNLGCVPYGERGWEYDRGQVWSGGHWREPEESQTPHEVQS